jgi:hypothetical protein
VKSRFFPSLRSLAIFSKPIGHRYTCFKRCILPKHSDIAMYMCVCFKEHVQVYFLSDSVKKHGYFMCIVKQNFLGVI